MLSQEYLSQAGAVSFGDLARGVRRRASGATELGVQRHRLIGSHGRAFAAQ